MAAITFNAAYRKEQLRERFGTAAIALRDTLDSFVSNRMRRAAANAEHSCARRLLRPQPKSVNAP